MGMDDSAINFLDLSTEVLYKIFKKLNNMHVLYSLFGVDDERLDTKGEKADPRGSMGIHENIFFKKLQVDH